MYEGGDGYEPMDRGRRNNGNGYGEYQLKMDLPYFNGNLHIEEFIEWMAKVEQFFDYINISEDRKLKLVAHRFKGVDSAWWVQPVMNNTKFNKRPVRTWDMLKTMSDMPSVMFTQYHQCTQGTRTMSDMQEIFTTYLLATI